MNKSKVIQRYVIWGFMIWLVICPLAWFALQFTEFTGDLTRIGKWREKDFGWNAPQPSIQSEFLTSSPINEADVLVIGDSFSDPLIWQSVLSEKGLKVTTIAWSQIGNICQDFSEKLRASGFKGQHIIIESVERLVSKQFSRSVACLNTTMWPTAALKKIAQVPIQISSIQEHINLQGQFWVGLKTIYHSIAIRLSDNYHQLHNWKSKSTHLYPIQNGCEYFSNKLCNWGLFFYEDYNRPYLNNEDLDNLRNIHQRLSDYKVAWLIIPNKSSVYQRTVDTSYWTHLSDQGLGPNLYRIFEEQKTTFRDLYLPNDSHLSIDGYRTLGQLTYQYIQK